MPNWLFRLCAERGIRTTRHENYLHLLGDGVDLKVAHCALSLMTITDIRPFKDGTYQMNRIIVPTLTHHKESRS